MKNEMRIRQLPANVVTKIAAGEVIERPASVVKELLENSIDAGSKRIDIELDNGGVDRIAVCDDGCGIHADDLSLAFASHATSKLTDAEDLFRIATLGFRGEALASIGGVAQVTLQSRPPEEACGSEVRCNGGDLSPVRPWNGSPGTRIEVRHLFYNTPVRKKFLRTTSTELGHVSETVTRLALANPALHLTLKHNGKLVYEVPATAGLLDRIGLFFGNEVRARLYGVHAERGPVTLAGYVADPACERGTAKMQYLFVNGRWVRDRSLGHAVQEAYRGLLMTGRYAVAFLFLELPPDQVDVNVHPTKAEVRFRDAQALFHLVLTTVRARLSAENLIPKLQAPTEAAGLAPAALPNPPPTSERHNGRAPDYHPPVFPTNGTSPAAPPVSLPLPVPPPAEPTLLPPLPPMRALQVHDSYLVIETPEGMLVLDQHALHERILFEQFKRRVRTGTLERQRLLIPEPVDLPADQAARTLEARAELTELGLEVEDFGGGTLLLASYPTLLGKLPPGEILRAVVDFLSARDRTPNREQMLNDLLAMMACKAAVKAGDRLGPDQIAALLEQRHLAADSHHCPHGRPTQLLFSRQELDKQFRRT